LFEAHGWHTHPLGQTLIVTSGVGLAQRWGGSVEEIPPGELCGLRRERSIGTARVRPAP